MGSGGEMDGCGQCIKYTMFFANIVIFLGGMVVLGVGVWTLLDKAYITSLLGSNLFLGAVYILIATGGLVAIIAFLGCLGAVKEVKCMLVTYFMIIFIVFVTMLVGGILGYVFREDVRKNLDKGMRSSLTQYGNKPTITEAWDETQTVLQCCGVDGPSDWNGRVPESCCKEAPNGSLQTSCNVTSAYQNGCLDVGEELIKDHASILGGTGIGVACLMIIGMIFSCVLFKMI